MSPFRAASNNPTSLGRPPTGVATSGRQRRINNALLLLLLLLLLVIIRSLWRREIVQMIFFSTAATPSSVCVVSLFDRSLFSDHHHHHYHYHYRVIASSSSSFLEHTHAHYSSRGQRRRWENEGTNGSVPPPPFSLRESRGKKWREEFTTSSFLLC